MVEVDSVAVEGRVVGEAEAGPVLRDSTLVQQLLAQLNVVSRLEDPGVPQAVDHEGEVVVELLVSLEADVKCLL